VTARCAPLRTSACLAAAPLAALGGCMVGPDYERPEAEVNEAWIEGAGDGPLRSDEPAPIEWWSAFGDPVLDELVEDAYRQNLTLREAAVRIVQSMAQRGIAFGELFPQQQEVSAFFDRERFSENEPSLARYANTWSVAFDATWELDVWGRFRRSIESEDALLDASIASYDDAMVTLVAEVATTYVTIRTLQRRVATAESNIDVQEQSARIAEARYRNGATSELDVTQATAALESTRAALPPLRAQLRQAMYQLSFLLGRPPMDLTARLGATGAIPAPPPEVAVGVPADLLRRRPDVRLAERQAASRSALIGVAEADLLPSFFISGSLGLRSSQGDNLFDSSSWVASILPGVSWPILNYGRLKNNVRVQDAEFQAAILAYQSAVLGAAFEVESGIAAFLGAREQLGHLEASETASERSLELARIRYAEGSSTFTRVLNSQAQLLQSQDALVVARGQVAVNLISTYKALGGGWEVRAGRDLLPDDTRREMEDRTDWGRMLRGVDPPLGDAEEAEGAGDAAAASPEAAGATPGGGG
jgi:NodT family efflux transporter outer membrane factor (OMF) lipoprotein